MVSVYHRGVHYSEYEEKWQIEHWNTSHRHGNLLNLILFPSSKTWHLWTTEVTWFDSSNTQRWSHTPGNEINKNQIPTTKPQIHDHWSHMDTPWSPNSHLETFLVITFQESLLEKLSKRQWKIILKKFMLTMNYEGYIVSRTVIWNENTPVRKIKDWKTFYGV